MKRLVFISFVLISSMSGCLEDGMSTLEIKVLNESGFPVKDAVITLHESKTDWAENINPIKNPIYTDENGIAEIDELPNGKYFVNITHGGETNRFKKKRTEQSLDSGNKITETFTIRPYSDWENILSGGDHIIWTLAPLMTPQGEPFLDYPVDTDMYLDGRWYDSNGRLGLWWFNSNESKIYYDYASTGAIVASDMVSLSPELFKAKIDFFGIQMIIEMYPN